MAISVIQSTVYPVFPTSPTTSLSLAFPSPVAAGSLIVCAVMISPLTIFLSGVTDNVNSGSYGTAVYRTGQPNGNIYITYFPNSAAGSITVTCNYSGSTVFGEIYLYEVSNVALTSPIGTAGVALTGTNKSPSSGNIVTTSSSILFGVSCITYDITAGESGWFTDIGPSFNAVQWAYKPTAGTYKSTFTQSSSGAWVAALVNFKETVVPPLFLSGNCNSRAQSSGVLTAIKMLSGECDALSLNSATTLILATVPMDGACTCASVNLGDMSSGQLLAGVCICSANSTGYLESRLRYAVLSVDKSMVLYAPLWDYRELHVFFQNSGGSEVYPVTMTPEPAFNPNTEYVLQRDWQINDNDVTPIWVVFEQTPEQLVVTNAQLFYNSIMALNVVDLFSASDLVWNQNTSLSNLTVGTGIHLAGICTAHAANTPTLSKDLVMRRMMESVNAILQCKFQQQH